MGFACCVAARDRTITNRSNSDVIPRNIRYSLSWNVRWENRRHVAGEETSVSWFLDGAGTNDRLDNKSLTTVGTAYASEEGSPLESFRNLTWQKSSPSEGYTVPNPGKYVMVIV
ncbi:RING/U-box superfamily protein [Artemisia annua]|uniref:RING/U-box superfamily protein n=1 Tax=Artemisia annua TaxID=35608 RepID=A0A2U1LYH3_ARTAN|nr:RING/U-box superfamily protein [Artemisia annua]